MIEERLDHALANSNWMTTFPNAKLTNLIASHSDHSPILLSCDTVQNNGRRYHFHFENSWLKEEGIKDVVCDGWNFEEQAEVMKKISSCAENLEKWSKDIRSLANRLKPILDKCVSEEQSAFVEGRSIFHNAMTATEIIHTLKRKTQGRRAHLALKIDINIVGPIVPGRGLRQGDPLSPYLFILITEGLPTLIKGTVAKANVDEVTHLMKVLETYAKASGQEINLNKYEVFFSRNLSFPAQEDLANVMGVRHVLGTGKYLGLPSMIGRSKKATFTFIKDGIWERINYWKGRSLSKAGKEVMIKSVLQAILAYMMSIYIFLETMISEIEKMLNAFWWCGGSNRKGIRWMAWDKLACSKREGGLGFRDFRAFNMAMVAKQGWFLMNNMQALVSRFFKARYFPKTTFLDANLGYNPSFVWRSIWKAREVLTIGCRWSIGDEAEEILFVPLVEDVTEDSLVWKEEKDGQYNVRSGYRVWKSRKKCYTQENHEVNWQVCSAVDRKVVGRFAVMIETLWHNRNTFIWNNEKEVA
ncbi:uncharacterized protein LOC131659256 [Vicia villosa]|uniref:uncharacterized protein LOC131659256 n=1 Tax=Vicia villosa TaxID=3911 RepID=UPI00273AD091|nr:uncharacterized protein LOC131659256 [Vicia villosa]